MKTVVLGALFAQIVLTSAAADDRVALPENYQESFIEYLSLDRVQNHDQFIRLFANPVAMEGKDITGELEDGSLLVAEVYSVVKDEDGNVVTSALRRRIKNEMILIAVMEKQDGWAQSSSSAIDVGDWDFGAFKPDGTLAGKDLDACRACHSPLKSSDFLFSIEHLPNSTKQSAEE
ncbi:MAG: cytochrome P460 family protein [Planctomycetota bacterium]